MEFTQIADTKLNVSVAGSNLITIRHWMTCVENGTSGDLTIDTILEYCDEAIKELEKAQNCLQTEIDNILKEEGYK